MMITYVLNGNVRCHPKVWKFPAGEVGVTVLPHNAPDLVHEIKIIASLTSSDEVMQLFLLTDALRRQFTNNPIVKLVLGYIPYSRQDRVCNEGDSLSIAVFAKLINAQEYASVTLVDPHSDVTPALFNKCIIYSQFELFKFHYCKHYKSIDDNRIIVAPDAGAAKKSTLIASEGNFSEIFYAVKTREMKTGKITDLKLTGNVEGKHAVVFDDIGDGMGTFVQLGNLLKDNGVSKLDLIVTHGIFSKGHEVVTSIYDKVITTNSYHQDRIGVIDGVEYVQIL